MTGEILLYSAPWCPDCRRAKQFLEELGVEYEVVDIDQEPQAAKELEERTGKRGIPYLKVGEEWIRAYEPGGGPFPRERILQAVSGRTSE
ncbi:MAG: glutaredoxin family protein [Planctomycetota bacterium]